MAYNLISNEISAMELQEKFSSVIMYLPNMLLTLSIYLIVKIIYVLLLMSFLFPFIQFLNVTELIFNILLYLVIPYITTYYTSKKNQN